MMKARILVATAVGMTVCVPAMVDAAQWDTSVALGVTVAKGNSESLMANGSVTGERNTDLHDLRIGMEANYGKAEVETTTDGTARTEKDTTTDNTEALLVYKRKFGRTYANSDNTLSRDRMAEIDVRMIAALGGGVFVLDTEKAKLGLELGAAYIREDRPGTRDEQMALRVAGRHDQKLSGKSKAWAELEFLPNSDDLDDYLMNAEAGVEAALNSSLSLRVVFEAHYDSVVPNNIEKDDLSLISSLVYTL